MLVAARMSELVALLGGCRYRFHDEKALQDGVEFVLRTAGVPYAREVSMGDTGRPDFMVEGVVIEVKTDKNLTAVTRQLHRYACHPTVTGVILVTNRMRFQNIPSLLEGKPTHVVSLLGSIL